MTKVLIAYGTHYGATASTSEEIANTLRQGGFEVRVADAKHERIEDIAELTLSLSAVESRLEDGQIRPRIS